MDLMEETSCFVYKRLYGHMALIVRQEKQYVLVLIPLKGVFLRLFKNMKTSTKYKFYVCHCDKVLTMETKMYKETTRFHVLSSTA